MPILEKTKLGELHHYTLYTPEQSPIMEVLTVEPLNRAEDYVSAYNNAYHYAPETTDYSLKFMEFSTRWLFLIPITLLIFLPLSSDPLPAICLFVLFLVSILTIYEIKRTYESYSVHVKAKRKSDQEAEKAKTLSTDIEIFYDVYECIKKEAENDESTILHPELKAPKFSPTPQGIRHDIDLYENTSDKNKRLLLLRRMEKTLQLIALQREVRGLLNLGRKIEDKKILYPIHHEQNNRIEEINNLLSDILALSDALEVTPEGIGTPQNPLLEPLLT